MYTKNVLTLRKHKNKATDHCVVSSAYTNCICDSGTATFVRLHHSKIRRSGLLSLLVKIRHRGSFDPNLNSGASNEGQQGGRIIMPLYIFLYMKTYEDLSSFFCFTPIVNRPLRT